eukprot:1244368-Amphidinium_carterae.1
MAHLNGALFAFAGAEYRLTQSCYPKMYDMWFDGIATPEQVEHLAHTKYARPDSGVFGKLGAYPSKRDGLLRRFGMLNFKVAQQGFDLMTVTKEELAQRIASITVDEEPHDKEAAQHYTTVLA